jgi:hypothetical protein
MPNGPVEADAAFAVSLQLTKLIRYMRQWNSKRSKSREIYARATAFVPGAQFGRGTEPVPHQYRSRSPRVPWAS